MTIRILRVDLSETNRLLERIAKALESLIEIPAAKNQDPSSPLTARDIGSYSAEDEDPPGSVAARLRASGASESEIERFILQQFEQEETAE